MGFHMCCEVCLLSLDQMKSNTPYFLLADMLSRIYGLFPAVLSQISGEMKRLQSILM